jgi:hypothetical protein
VPKALSKDECNKLCKKCLRECRQPASAVLVDCPRFMPLPFKVDKHSFDQLDLFGAAANDSN